MNKTGSKIEKRVEFLNKHVTMMVVVGFDIRNKKKFDQARKGKGERGRKNMISSKYEIRWEK